MKKCEETGRSMIEMVAVLVIILLLSITGLQGYRYAMNKHKANGIIDEANKIIIGFICFFNSSFSVLEK